MPPKALLSSSIKRLLVRFTAFKETDHLSPKYLLKAPSTVVRGGR